MLLLSTAFFVSCGGDDDDDDAQPDPTCNVQVTANGTDATTNGGADGTAIAVVTGGQGNITYQWNTTPPQTTATATNLEAGQYTVTVSDDVRPGCSTTASVTIGEPAAGGGDSTCELTISTSKTDATTNGGADGTATVTVSGDQGTVSISWDTDPVQTTETATGLSAGTYTVTVTDDITGDCEKSGTVTVDEPAASGPDPGDISVLQSLFYHDASVTFDIGEEFITITTTDEPDHKSMYYDQSNSLYEAYSEPENPDFKQNPNNIVAQNIVFKVPRFPSESPNKTSTALGPFGVSVNGVVFFNQQAAPGDDILDELNTFDQYEGHPTGDGTYHYHIEPVWLTETLGSDKFLGVLMDGFPVYGPVEYGVTLTNDDLDEYHGHSHATEEFPDGIYHYHVTEELPWINGGEYFGVPGTATN